MATVFIADYDFGDVDIERDIVERAGFTLAVAQCKSEDDVIALGRDADAVLTQYAPIGARAIEAFTRCRVIARYGTGVDIVDVDAATRKGIQVTNAPNDWCADEVADHAISLWLAAARKICTYDRATRRGEWHWRPDNPSGACGAGSWASSLSASSRAALRSGRNRSASISGFMIPSSTKGS
jgi:D-3-phosphoglycerate dehydrogenase